MADNLELEEIPNTVSLSRQVEERIRAAIIAGRMKPNVLYTETSLAAQMGVSRTPVREAVLDLASRGFVTVLPRRGFQIRIFSEQAIREVYELRWALESHAVRTLADHPERYDFSTLLEAANAQKESAIKAEISGAVASGRSFHMKLLELCANGMICKIFEEIRDILSVTWAQAFTHSISAADVASDHILLAGLIRQGKADEACTLLREHLKRSEKAVLAAQSVNAS